MKKLLYPCLILDHDDTSVKSTPEIHYPQWCETLELMRPECEMDLHTFMRYNSELGFYTMLKEVMHFTKEEQALQYKMWCDYMESHTASFYEGLPEIMREYCSLGGKIFVCTHNRKSNILRDYAKEFSGELIPEHIFDCEEGGLEKIKPNPWALEQISEKYGFKKGEMLLVDDMKPGYDMAKSFGIPFACAGWSHIVKEVRDYMKQVCPIYLEKTEELRRLIISEQ